jgi:hypothetical protein
MAVSGCGAPPVAPETTAETASALVALDRIVAGVDVDGSLLYPCIAGYAGGTIPGKMKESWTSCDIGYGGAEVWVANNYALFLPWRSSFAGDSPSPLFQVEGLAINVCRAVVGGGIHPGTLLADGCHVPYGGEDLLVTTAYDVLLKPSFEVETDLGSWGGNPFPYQAIFGGVEADGTRLYLCADYSSNVYRAGKTHSTWGSCDVPLNGGEFWSTGSSAGVLRPLLDVPRGVTSPQGKSPSGEVLGVCSVEYAGSIQVGAYHFNNGSCEFGFGGMDVVVSPNAFGTNILVLWSPLS